MRKWGLIFVMALAGFVLGGISCLILYPLWRDLEEISGIEMVGHSGPADWLFLTCAALGAVILVKLRKRIVG